MASSKSGPKRGVFVVFEGPDGSGKTQQMAGLARHLRQNGETVIETREPGGTPLGDEIRGLLLNREHVAIDGLAELFLLAAARAQHVQDVIEPAIAGGTIVLCDRYVDSSFAYQGGGRGLAVDSIAAVQQVATGGRLPDGRVVLDVPVEVGLARRFADTAEINRLDRADGAFHERVREAYLSQAHTSEADWIVVDAVPSFETVARDLQTRVLERIRHLRQSW
ncbi:MAG: dTMP kinase [Thermomicrobiales bacterium]